MFTAQRFFRRGSLLVAALAIIACGAVSCTPATKGTPGYCKARYNYCTTSCHSWSDPGNYGSCASICASERGECLKTLPPQGGGGRN